MVSQKKCTSGSAIVFPKIFHNGNSITVNIESLNKEEKEGLETDLRVRLLTISLIISAFKVIKL